MLKQQFFNLSFVAVLALSPICLNAQDLIPLKVGNSWTYIQEVSLNGELIEKDTIASSIEKSNVYNNKQWFFMNELGYDYIVRNGEEGQFELDTLKALDDGNFKEVLMFKKKVDNPQRSYQVYDDITVTLSENTFPVKTILGDFDCIKYTLDYQEKNEYIEFYITPGIGVIQHRWFEKGKITTITLIDYDLK